MIRILRIVVSMEQIFKDHGSIRALALDLGLPYTTVHSWKVRGRVPLEYHDEVILSCARRDIAVTHRDLRDAALVAGRRQSGVARRVC